jgi:hypothetical protein
VTPPPDPPSPDDIHTARLAAMAIDLARAHDEADLVRVMAIEPVALRVLVALGRELRAGALQRDRWEAVRRVAREHVRAHEEARPPTQLPVRQATPEEAAWLRDHPAVDPLDLP